MSKNLIYIIGPNGAQLKLQGDKHVVAILPAGKGDNGSAIITSEGKFSNLKGQRLYGIGVTRYVTELGYVPAPEGDANAAALADYVDMDVGRKMVQDASSNEAQRLHKLYGGMECSYVPFNPHHPTRRIKVNTSSSMCVRMGIGIGFCSGIVPGEYVGDNNFITDAYLGDGWLVAPGVDPESAPRSSDYGGLVEHAVFILVGSGMGTIIGPASLQPDENAAEDAPYPRGKMVIGLTGSNDQVVVGINALDELVVEYVREDKVLYQRTGLGHKDTAHLNVGVAVGSIAAVLARVADMDTPVKKDARRAA
ncbi:MAG: hypothetical protein LW865_02140 [Betaproteobacteria bacterium]|jgi:hypothetical protein|nr:hypothetical protein [Betaproteobacteria bacterium]